MTVHQEIGDDAVILRHPAESGDGGVHCAISDGGAQADEIDPCATRARPVRVSSRSTKLPGDDEPEMKTAHVHRFIIIVDLSVQKIKL